MMINFAPKAPCGIEESRKAPDHLDMLVSSHFRWQLKKGLKGKSVIKSRKSPPLSLLEKSGEKYLSYIREDSLLDRLCSPFNCKGTGNLPEPVGKHVIQEESNDFSNILKESEKSEPVRYLSVEEMWARCSGYMLVDPDKSKPKWKCQMPKLPKPPDIYLNDEKDIILTGNMNDSSMLSIDDFLKPPVCPPTNNDIFQIPSYLEEMRPGPGRIETVHEDENLLRIYHLSFLKENDLLCPPMDLVDPEIIRERENFVSRALKPGSVLDNRFEIIKVVMEKRYGNTYLVLDKTITGRKMIVKETIPEPMPSDEYMERLDAFQDTIRILTRFSAPGLVEIYGSFQQNGREYYFMEKADGIDLERLTDMNVSCFTAAEVVKWGSQICHATEHLHNRPIPITLGELLPRHVMVNETGNVRIVGFDLQRFFDRSTNLAFRPDSSHRLYGDITKIARVLYFLLTKQNFEKTPLDRLWPKPVPAKLKKILNVACRQDQQAFGHVTSFRRMLEDSLNVDKPRHESTVLEYPCRSPLQNVARRAMNLVKSQKPVIKAAFIILILFVMGFNVFSGLKDKNIRNFILPDEKMAWVLAGDELMLFNPHNFSLIHRKMMNRQYSSILKIPRKTDTPEEKPILLMSGENSPAIEVFNASNLSCLSSVNTPFGVTELFSGGSFSQIYALHRSRGLYSRLQGEDLNLADSSLAGSNPDDFILLEGLNFKSNDSPIAGNESIVAVSSADDGRVLLLSAENGRIKRALSIKGEPGPMAYCPVRKKLYVAEKSEPSILMIDPVLMKVEKRFPLMGKGPSAIVISSSSYKLWIAMKDSNTVEVADPVIGNSRTLQGFGTGPGGIEWDRNNRRIWVMNHGTKDLAIFDEKSENLLHRIDLGKTPRSLIFDY